MFIESVMLSNHHILCCPLLLLPLIKSKEVIRKSKESTQLTPRVVGRPPHGTLNCDLKLQDTLGLLSDSGPLLMLFLLPGVPFPTPLSVPPHHFIFA